MSSSWVIRDISRAPVYYSTVNLQYLVECFLANRLTVDIETDRLIDALEVVEELVDHEVDLFFDEHLKPSCLMKIKMN